MAPKFQCLILGEPWNKSVDNGNLFTKGFHLIPVNESDQQFYLAEWHVMFGAICHKINTQK